MGSYAQYADTIGDASQDYGIPDGLLAGLIQTENGSFNPNATNTNSDGTVDYGLGQINSSNLSSLGVTNPFDPTQSIYAAAQLLASNYQSTGSWQGALEEYNSGSATGAPAYAAKVQAAAATYGYNAGTANSPNASTGSTILDNILSNLGGDSSGMGISAPTAALGQTGATPGAVGSTQGQGSGVVAGIEQWITSGIASGALVVIGIILLLGAVYMFAVDRGVAPPPSTIVKAGTEAALA